MERIVYFMATGPRYRSSQSSIVNTDKSLIVRVWVNPDGSPGQPEVWAVLQEVPESPAFGNPIPAAGDGLALDVHGNVYVTVLTRAAVVRINAGDLSQPTIAVFGSDPDAPLFAVLNFPNTIAFGTGKGGRQSLFVTNIGYTNASRRGLVKIEAGVPGIPLP